MFTISLEINLLSESSISCFSFFLLDLPFLVHPSIVLWLILKIKINEFRMFSAASQIVEAELFFGALYLYSIYWEWQGYSLPYEHWYLIHSWSDKAFRCTVVNRALTSLHEGSLEITLTVPLKELQEYARSVDIPLTASCMDEDSASFLHSVNVPFFKIGSGDVNNIPLIEKGIYH